MRKYSTSWKEVLERGVISARGPGVKLHGGDFTIQPRSTQGFSTVVPALACPFDSQNDGVTLTVLAVPSGTPLASASRGFQLLPLAGVRGG